MNTELLMHVAALHIQDRIGEADRQRQIREARRTAKASSATSPRRPRWHFTLRPAQPVPPAR